MKGTRTTLAAAFLALLFLSTAHAQEPIHFGRTPDISPDGRLVAFSYLGDIWTVETIGGIARPVTMHEAHDAYPVFSPDGRYIAFSSNRHGSYDVFVVPAVGGRPKRLTFDSGTDLVSGWSPDGKSILFTSTRGNEFPSSYELYYVPVEGGRVRRVTRTEGKDGVFSPKGDQIAYVRGPGTWYRKGYRGSSNDDIWVCNLDGSNNRRITDFNGQDTSPMWSPDGQYLYYVSECFGTPPKSVANVVRLALTPNAKPEQITFQKDDSVRRARLSGNGEWIVYECGADLWVTPTHGGSPRKLAIEVHADDKTNTERTVTFTQGASEFALSSDESHIAFVVHGQIFMMPTAGGKAVRLTEVMGPCNNHGIAWSPDSKKIIFASDRNGFEDLYLLEPDDPEHPQLVKAHRFKVKQLTFTPEAEIGAGFAPNGNRVAFVRGGKLYTMKPDGTDQKVLVKDGEVFDYDWSPDSRYIVYARRDSSFASDLYIIPSAGGEPKNVTRFGTYNGGVTWSARGKKLSFISERRRNQVSLFVLSLQKPVAPGASSAGSDIDWEDIHLRVDHPAPVHIEEGAISADGNMVAFRAWSTGGEDLWVASTNGSQLARLTVGNQRPQQIQWSRYSPDLIYFRDAAGALRKARTTGGAASLFSFMPANDRIPFTAKMTVRRDEEFNEMFEQSWRALSEDFYDPLFHGINWLSIRLKYRPLVKHVALKEDFYSLVSLMLGELNASHLGIMGFTHPPEERTAELGLLFDESYSGLGLKIAEVLKRGPADKRGITLKPDEIIISIDGVQLTNQVNLSKLLNDKINEPILLQVVSASAKITTPETRAVADAALKLLRIHTTARLTDYKSRPRRVEIQGSAREPIRDLMYERWVQHNAERVAKLSNGKLGYIHIPSMDEEGMDRFVRALYSDCFDKEAIVLDVRYNGGGYTHDQILSYLGGREHTFFRMRDGGQGAVMRSFDRKWSKPLVLLINNRSYSDAEIFPSAFRTLGLGKLVGQPTGAHVIGTTGVQLIDGSLFRIPRIGVYNMAGENMEQKGVTPDVLVDQHPDQLAKGIDPQLDKAVEVLQQDVVAWKKARTPRTTSRPEEKTAVAVPTVTGK
jgi:tricorn protease